MRRIEGRAIRLLRHPETEFNIEEKVGGCLNPAVTAEGEAAARRLGKELQMDPGTVVYSGTRDRHIVGAELVSLQPRDRIIRTGLLDERKYGIGEGEMVGPLLRRFWWTDHSGRLDIQPFRGMERDRYLLRQRDIFDKRLLRRHPDSPILAVSSEDKLATWLDHLGIQRIANLGWVDLAGPKGTPLAKLELVDASDGVVFKAAA